MHKYGLIGKNIQYSFSKSYFDNKFSTESILASYENFDIQNISQLDNILKNNLQLKGFNVTIPFKEEIIDYIHTMDSQALEIGAVNTVKIVNKQLHGYNTDIYGFINSLKPLLKRQHSKALVLGSGGAAKAICFGLKLLGMDYIVISRKPNQHNQTSYHKINATIIQTHQVVINCTPIGTYPNIKEYPPIPYKYLTEEHLLYDLVYNPHETTFLKKGKERGCQTINGYQMLVLQAEKSWEIWNR